MKLLGKRGLVSVIEKTIQIKAPGHFITLPACDARSELGRALDNASGQARMRLRRSNEFNLHGPGASLVPAPCPVHLPRAVTE